MRWCIAKCSRLLIIPALIVQCETQLAAVPFETDTMVMYTVFIETFSLKLTPYCEQIATR
jgi:hypothetical protein